MNARRTGVEALSSMMPVLGGRSRRLATTVILAVAVWASTLPFALLLVVPRVGIGSAIPITIGSLAGILLLVVAASRLGQSWVHGDGLAGRSGGGGVRGGRACPAKTSASPVGRPQEERHQRRGYGYRTGAVPIGPLPGDADHECRPWVA